MKNLQHWEPILVCPIDGTQLSINEGLWICKKCGFRSSSTEVEGDLVPDFRALDSPQTVQVSFDLPVTPLIRKAAVREYFKAVDQNFEHHSRRQIRKKFGTKLSKGIQFYCQKLLMDFGPDSPILDLGCGNGGNRRYLRSLGFRNVLAVDWSSSGAEVLVDAHRLPFSSNSFKMVISTAVFEHLYNPFLAISEVGRVLTPGGYFLAGASFLESWHGSSFFHLTPDGWNALCEHAELNLEDLWSGWGVFPAVLIHGLAMPWGRFTEPVRDIGYGIQAMGETLIRIMGGESVVRRLQLRASGSFQIFARKLNSRD